MKRALATGLVAATLLLAPSSVLAQAASLDDWTAVDAFRPSPENFGLELRIGSYMPTNLGAGWDTMFGGDLGPLLAFEIHYFATRIPYLGLIGGGGGLGWSQYSGRAARATTTTAEQGADASFEIVPILLTFVWRFDTLARDLNVPIILTPKVGLDLVYWGTGTGTRGEADGWSIGPRFAGKVSLELDFLEPRSARQLDEEWGVNHSELFVELWYSMAGELTGRQLPLGGWGWVAGLGITF